MDAAVGASDGCCGSAFLSLPHLPDGDIAAGGAIVEDATEPRSKKSVGRNFGLLPAPYLV